MKKLPPLMFLLGIILHLICSAYAEPAEQNPENSMKRADVDGIQLEYEVRGSGDPIVLIHAGVFADWFMPLIEEKTLTANFQIVSYHRAGYAGSTRVNGALSIKKQAEHVLSLMKRLGIKRAHVVGHSSGGNIALQLALDAPEAVHTLILLEPALKILKNTQQRSSAMAPVVEHYRSGNKSGAVDAFMRAVAGPDYRADLEQVLPGAFDQAVKDSNTFFEQEWPAVQQWSFTREDAFRIKQPALAVIGEKDVDVPVWKERQEMLREWLPNVEPFVLPGTTHLLHLQNTRGMADRIADFCERHPIRASQ